MACSFAIFCVPKESTMVTMELSASGMAATASATANKNASPQDSPLKTLTPNRIPQKTRIMMDSFWPNWSRFICSGVFFSEVVFSSLAIFPTSVSMPMEVTRKEPRP